MKGGVRLRPWRDSDCRRVWELANAPEVRAVSLNPEPIPYGHHERWFADVLADTARRGYMIEVDGVDAGYIRLDGNEISVAVDAGFRGRGVGCAAIRAACGLVAGPLVAYVLPDNQASRRVFEACGFDDAGPATVRGRECHRFEWNADHGV